MRQLGLAYVFMCPWKLYNMQCTPIAIQEFVQVNFKDSLTIITFLGLKLLKWEMYLFLNNRNLSCYIKGR